MELHMKEFDGTTFGMSVEASSPAFKRMKKNAFTGKVVPYGRHHEKTVRCVRAADVAAVMGQAGWLVSGGRYMETIRWGGDGTEHYIIYEKELEITNQKYEITDIAHEEYPFLHRIRALRDIGPTVKAGDLGGFVENEGNLSFEFADDVSWIADDAIAANAAYVGGDSLLRDRAVVCGEARVQGGSMISDDARIEDHAVVDGARVELWARVSARAKVFVRPNSGFPIISGESMVHGVVSGNVLVTGAAVILGDEGIVNEAADRLVLTEDGRSIERGPGRDVLLPSAQYFGREKPSPAKGVRPKSNQGREVGR